MGSITIKEIVGIIFSSTVFVKQKQKGKHVFDLIFLEFKNPFSNISKYGILKIKSVKYGW